MTQSREKIRVAVNGYGVIGKRVADAVAAQDDMEVAGIADVEADWRLHVALKKVTSCSHPATIASTRCA